MIVVLVIFFLVRIQSVRMLGRFLKMEYEYVPTSLIMMASANKMDV